MQVQGFKVQTAKDSSGIKHSSASKRVVLITGGPSAGIALSSLSLVNTIFIEYLHEPAACLEVPLLPTSHPEFLSYRCTESCTAACSKRLGPCGTGNLRD